MLFAPPVLMVATGAYYLAKDDQARMWALFYGGMAIWFAVGWHARAGRFDAINRFRGTYVP